MSATTTTLSPLIQADPLAPKDDEFGPAHFNAVAAHNELDDYQQCYEQVKENWKDIAKIMKDLRTQAIIPDQQRLEDHKEKLNMGFLHSRQYQNFRRKVRVLSPHELTGKFKKGLLKIEVGLPLILNKSEKAFKQVSSIAEAYYGSPIGNISSPLASPKTPFRPTILKQNKGEKKINLSIDTRMHRTPILYKPDSTSSDS
jgi:hypothetical protein